MVKISKILENAIIDAKIESFSFSSSIKMNADIIHQIDSAIYKKFVIKMESFI